MKNLWFRVFILVVLVVGTAALVGQKIYELQQADRAFQVRIERAKQDTSGKCNANFVRLVRPPEILESFKNPVFVVAGKVVPDKDVPSAVRDAVSSRSDECTQAEREFQVTIEQAKMDTLGKCNQNFIQLVRPPKILWGFREPVHVIKGHIIPSNMIRRSAEQWRYLFNIECKGMKPDHRYDSVYSR